MRAERKPCQICYTPTQSIGYKAFVCGACSIFYRRNYRNQERLLCKQRGDCNLKLGRYLNLNCLALLPEGNRNACRACRMKMCRTLGLRMAGNSLVIQCNGFPRDDIDEETVRQNGVISLTRHTEDRNDIVPNKLMAGTTSQPQQQPQPSTITTKEKAGNAFSESSTNLSYSGMASSPMAVTFVPRTSLDFSYPVSSSNSTQPVLIMPVPPIMNVFDPPTTILHDPSSKNATATLVETVVNLRRGEPSISFASLINETSTGMPRIVGAFSCVGERQ